MFHHRILLALAFLSTIFFMPAQEVDMGMFHGMSPRAIGPAGMSGRVTSIDVVDKDTDIIYLGTAAGGIFKSENAGHTWTPIFDDEHMASIGDIAIYQNNPSILYVGTGEGNPRNSQNSGYGMYKSLDGGRTWTHLGLENSRQIHRVVIHPDNPDIVWVGVSGATWGDSEIRGVYRTDDGGDHWKQVLYADNRTGCSDLVIDPYNPNRLIAGMWEHRREPWFFTSGGPGSAIFVSDDGGEDWQKVTEGLPESDLGRIGLSFAPSRQHVVYAYVESKSNGIYKSSDGGRSWNRVSSRGDRNIGDRPFYYADIYVDPTNENRIYSIASTVTVSEDGGKNWSSFAPGNKIHTDHHAWWSHPTDPDFLMVGHDGGFNVTHDRGKNWWFADNLPLGQFYHIRVDNEIPYNVYGGLQDNGSWKGPNLSWFKGGVRNMYWQRLSVGDGFDVVPDPMDHTFGYAMGQAGNLVRYHTVSGQLYKIRPIHPDGAKLRFNWNAGIAISPIDQKTIFYGSQYLHKSSDHGASWDIISPDLTTNDPSKQVAKTGGLTLDATGAENHTTIIAIAPSPLDEQVIWVGTDDGNVQLTRDGGANWENTIDRIEGVPSHTWVPHIHPSNHRAGEAFVVFDDHRRDNWEPYVYHTDNFGRSWSRIVGSDDVIGYVYVILQDDKEPNLLFCGTETGLYVSFDKGEHWNRWTHDYPTVPTSDLAIQSREDDLAIGTFGRSIYILDDIEPIRAVSREGISTIQSEELVAFEPPTAYQAIIGESIGYRQGKIGDALFEGENRRYGALISYFLSEDIIGNDGGSTQVSITILRNNQVVRTLREDPIPGVNRVAWDFRKNRVRYPMESAGRTPSPRPGFVAPPGEYVVRIEYGGREAVTTLDVVKDPRINVSEDQITAKVEVMDAFEKDVSSVTAVMDEVRDYRKSLNFLSERIKMDSTFSGMTDQVEAVKERLRDFELRVQGERGQGIYSDPTTINSQMSGVRYLMDHVQVPVTPNLLEAMDNFKSSCETFISEFRMFQREEMKPFVDQVNELNLSVF